MDLVLSDEDLAFRDEARAWLSEHVPTSPRPAEGPEAAAFDRAWQRAQYDAGWAGVAWPVEFGGRGLTLTKQLLWHEQAALCGAPYSGYSWVGLNHAGPIIIEHGTEGQRRRFLEPILRGDEFWTQAFSEPGAGSDLANVSTRAVVDGDELVINGSKIWTSYAQYATWQELLCRTDGERHVGLTWVICDNHLPGIEIRPIRSIMGTDHFCEVFYDDVRVPLENVVGDLGRGWQVAMATLVFERTTAFVAEQLELVTTVEQLVELARTVRSPLDGRPVVEHEDVALRLGEVRAATCALRALMYAGLSRAEAHEDAPPGTDPGGSVLRLFFSRLQQQVSELALDIRGMGTAELDGPHGWGHRYLHTRATTIAAGSSDIQRGIIARRVLGLPR